MVGEQANLLLFERKSQQILQWLQAYQTIRSPRFRVHSPGNILRSALLKRAWAMRQRLARRSSKRKSIFQEQLKQKPEDPYLHVQLAKVLAWLGEKDAAIAEAQQATDLRPESKDAFDGPRITEDVAQVYAILGDNTRAIELLDGLLSRPSRSDLAKPEDQSGVGSNPERSGLSRRSSPNTPEKLNFGTQSCDFATLLCAIRLWIAFCVLLSL